MPFTVAQLEFLGAHVGVAVPTEFLENKRRAELFKQRRAQFASEHPDLKDHHQAEAIKAALAEGDELAAGGKRFADALGKLDHAEQLAQMPPPPPAPPPAPPAAEVKAAETPPQPAPAAEPNPAVESPPPAPAQAKIETQEQKREREAFLERWSKVEPAMAEVDKILADKTYGNPPRGKIGPAATGYLAVKAKVAKAEEAEDYKAALAGLDEVDGAVKAFKNAQREQTGEDRARYFNRFQPNQKKTGNYRDWIRDGKLPAGKEAADFQKAESTCNGLAFKSDFVGAFDQLDALEGAIQKLETVAAVQLGAMQQLEAEQSRRKKILGQTEATGDLEEKEKGKPGDADKAIFEIRRKRLEDLASQLDKQLKDKKFAAEFAQAAGPYRQAKPGLLAKVAAEMKKDPPDRGKKGEATRALDELEVIVHDFEAEIQKAAVNRLNQLQAGKQPPLDKTLLGKVKDEALRYAKLDPRALKGVDPAVLDQLVGAVGAKAKSGDSKTLVKAAMISKFDMVGAEGDLSTAALPRLYEVMGKVPKSHTRDNPLMQKVKREKPRSGENEKSSFYKSGYIYLSLQRTGKNTEGFDQDDDVDADCKVDATEHSRFDAVTLHEIGHAVDDKEKFMESRGASPQFGGWRFHNQDTGMLVEVAEVVGEAKGFYKDFPNQPRALLRSYLRLVCEGETDPKGKLAGKTAQMEAGASAVTRDELLGDPAMVQAEMDRKQFLAQDWSAPESLAARNSADTDLSKLMRLKGDKRTVLKHALKAMLQAGSAAESLSAADAAAAALKEFCVATMVDAAAAAPDWAALDRHAAVAFCKALRYDGGKGLWDQKASGASKYAINGRLYQESYKGKWYSYATSARKQGVSSYQFRAPGEWFAEVYSAFFMKKLPKAHPLHKWLTDQVAAG